MKPLSETNPYLRDPRERDFWLKYTVYTSAAIEGINVPKLPKYPITGEGGCMTKRKCTCGMTGYPRCPVHGDNIRGVGVTDDEFIDLVARNKGAVLEIFKAGEVIPIKKCGRPRKGGAR